MSRIQHRIDDLGDRTNNVKRKLTEYATTYNKLVDAPQSQIEEFNRINGKLADLEDHSRRKNLKIRGIPESISSSAELFPYLQQLFKILVPTFSPLSPDLHPHNIPYTWDFPFKLFITYQGKSTTIYLPP